MSSVVRKDWEFSDDVFKSESSNKIFEIYYESTLIKKATIKEDIYNNIDYYINGIPIQWRAQRVENVKGSINNYVPTFRFSRECSLYKDRKKSEFMKICINKNNGLPYPKHHIWCLVDKNSKIIKCMIVDIDKFVYDYQNEEYEIWFTKVGKKINNSNTGRIISLKQNYDNSSEFILLNEKYLLPNTIIYKYTSN